MIVDPWIGAETSGYTDKFPLSTFDSASAVQDILSCNIYLATQKSQKYYFLCFYFVLAVTGNSFTNSFWHRVSSLILAANAKTSWDLYKAVVIVIYFSACDNCSLTLP